MARASSVISVSIIGDAKKLIGAAKDADKATGGLGKSALKIGGAAIAIDKVFDVVNDSLGKADDFNDAFATLARTIGRTDADKIKDMAFDMTKIGLSADEVGVLATSFANFATAAGVASPTISALTPDILDIAAAIHAQSPDKTLDEIVSDIGKAAGGAKKPVQDLGVVIDKALSPEDQLTSILEQLKSRYGDAQTAAEDFAGSQESINAKFDNFKIKLGEVLDGPLKGVLDIFNNIIDDIPQLDTNLRDFAGGIESAARMMLGPLGNVRDLLADIVGLLDQTNTDSTVHHVNTGVTTDRNIAEAVRREAARNGRNSDGLGT